MLKDLGIFSGNKKEAEDALSLLGRSGQLPWVLDHIRNSLTYLSPSNRIVVPPAHNLLHGLTSNLFVFSLKTTSTEAPRPELFSENPVILDHAARDFVRVSSLLSINPLLQCMLPCDWQRCLRRQCTDPYHSYICHIRCTA
jgi:hypothetical protein